MFHIEQTGTKMLRKRKPHRAKKKRSILSYKGFWFGILAIIAIKGLFYLIFFSAWFQITEIKIRGNQKICEQEIHKLIQPKIVQQIVRWEMSESERFGISTRSIFLADLNEANKTILNKFPLIGKVEIKRDFPNALVVIVVEREPIAIFYQDEQAFLIDKQGVIFYPVNESNQYLRIESLFLAEELKLGKKILEEELISQILKIRQQAKEIDILIIKTLIVSDERLNVKTLENWEIYFNLKDDISAQIFHLNLTLNEIIPPEKRKNLEYIDLRFSPRVFFRYYEN